jgi:molybdopterin-guanine dinucleotide biosynthesis protein A
MGLDKAALPFGASSLLDRVLGLVQPYTADIVLAAAADQVVPAGFQVVRDSAPDAGPLPALLGALDVVSTDFVFVIACDTPLLQPTVIPLLASLCAGWDGAVPVVQDRRVATCAVYRVAALREAGAEFGNPRHRSLQHYLGVLRIREVPPEVLRTADPDLLSFVPCNTPEEYARALRIAGVSVNGG